MKFDDTAHSDETLITDRDEAKSYGEALRQKNYKGGSFSEREKAKMIAEALENIDLAEAINAELDRRRRERYGLSPVKKEEPAPVEPKPSLPARFEIYCRLPMIADFLEQDERMFSQIGRRSRIAAQAVDASNGEPCREHRFFVNTLHEANDLVSRIVRVGIYKAFVEVREIE